MNIALILAGGKGTRMMKKIPKQFLIIQDKPLIIHTLLKFDMCKDIDKVCVICLSEYKEHMKTLIDEYGISKVDWIIGGGSNRHQSILKGVEFLKGVGMGTDDIVVIHNANMPMITIQNISECIIKAKNNSTVATTAAKCTGYFYQIDNENIKIGPDRSLLFGAKTPEALNVDMAYELYSNPKYQEKIFESYTAGMLAIDYGYKVSIVLCDSTNIKVTSDDDYKLVSTFLSNER